MRKSRRVFTEEQKREARVALSLAKEGFAEL